jgi:hypothetical protein
MLCAPSGGLTRWRMEPAAFLQTYLAGYRVADHSSHCSLTANARTQVRIQLSRRCSWVIRVRFAGTHHECDDPRSGRTCLILSWAYGVEQSESRPGKPGPAR